MTRDQKIVAAGAASGILFTGVAVWLLQQVLPVPDAPTAGERLAYAAQWAALAAVPFFFMLAAIGNARFLGQAIDPTLGRESPRMVVDGRVAENTTQQLLLFVVGSLALAASLSPAQLPIVGAAAITFFVARVAFWVGYRIHPLYRAFGSAATGYLNLGLLAAALWLALD